MFPTQVGMNRIQRAKAMALSNEQETSAEVLLRISEQFRLLAESAYELGPFLARFEGAWDGEVQSNPEARCHACDQLFVNCLCEPNLTWEYQFKEGKEDGTERG